MSRIRVAVVGLKFGAEFVPIYLHHPNVKSVAVCDTNADLLRKIGDRFGIEQRFTSFDDVVANPSIDAVTAANWTAAGICAHESAMKGGEAVTIPDIGKLP